VQLRVINLGSVSPLKSQSVYHGIAHAMRAGDAPVLVLCSPGRPYLSVGMHQQAELEFDLQRCKAHNLSIIPRQTGGGCVLLDQQQLFFQFIFHRSIAPTTANELYPRLLQPIIDCYQHIGIAAQQIGLTDLQVGGKKITGSGAASIGEATVLVGNFIHAFDARLMANVIHAPSDEYRQLFAEQLQQRMTSIQQQGKSVDNATLIAKLHHQIPQRLGLTPISSELTQREQHEIMLMEQELLEDSEWQISKKLVSHGIKICAHTYVTERVATIAGNALRCLLLQQTHKIIIAYLFVNQDRQHALETSFHHCALNGEQLRSYLQQADQELHPYAEHFIELLLQSRIDPAI